MNGADRDSDDVPDEDGVTPGPAAVPRSDRVADPPVTDAQVTDPPVTGSPVAPAPAQTVSPHAPASESATIEGSPARRRDTWTDAVLPKVSSADDGRTRWHDPDRGPDPTASGPVTRRWRKIIGRTISKAWGDSLFGMSAQAAFWSALSTAPMLLALLGLLIPLIRAIDPSWIPAVREEIFALLNSIFTEEVAEGLIGNAVDTILDSQTSAISIGLILTFWAGSSAMAAFVESITIAYNQHEVRHPVKERIFALGLYLIALVFGIVLLPLLAIGPDYLIGFFPQDVQDDIDVAIQVSYFPAVGILLILLLTTLYKVAPKYRHPWKRGLGGAVLAAIVFIVASIGLRIYLQYVYSNGLTYGALATPIAYLLFYYFAAIAIIIGAQFNNALLEYHPPRKVYGRT